MIYLMDPRWMDKRFAAPMPPKPDESFLRRREALDHLLPLLPPCWRQVVLSHMRETPFDRIDEQLGLEPGDAEALLRKAEDRLKQMAKAFYPKLCANGNGRGP